MIRAPARAIEAGDALHPCCFLRAELRGDTPAAVLGELDAGMGALHGGRHRLDQRVAPDGEQRIRQYRQQVPDDPKAALRA
jgi:hypothetical protein